MAVWRIGAQSEGVEKSLHLNAPLHPNNSSASWKKKEKTRTHTSCSVFSCFTPLHSLSEQLWRAHTWLPSIRLPYVSAVGSLFEELFFFWKVLGLITGTPDIVPVDLAPAVVAKATVQCGWLGLASNLVLSCEEFAGKRYLFQKIYPGTRQLPVKMLFQGLFWSCCTGVPLLYVKWERCSVCLMVRTHGHVQQLGHFYCDFCSSFSKWSVCLAESTSGHEIVMLWGSLDTQNTPKLLSTLDFSSYFKFGCHFST